MLCINKRLYRPDRCNRRYGNRSHRTNRTYGCHGSHWPDRSDRRYGNGSHRTNRTYGCHGRHRRYGSNWSDGRHRSDRHGSNNHCRQRIHGRSRYGCRSVKYRRRQ